jgi:nucleotide-binding universal stress UspA family protein
MQLKRILMALAGSASDADLIHHAATIAKANKAQLVAVHVIEVRWNLPLDAVLEPELERGERLLEDAVRLAEAAGVKMETELLQAREAAAAIVDTARSRDADLVLIGMPYRKRMGRVYVARTVEDVYLGAHCAVLAYRQEEPQ